MIGSTWSEIQHLELPGATQGLPGMRGQAERARRCVGGLHVLTGLPLAPDNPEVRGSQCYLGLLGATWGYL